jgi:hypothetical protein
MGEEVPYWKDYEVRLSFKAWNWHIEQRSLGPDAVQLETVI